MVGYNWVVLFGHKVVINLNEHLLVRNRKIYKKLNIPKWHEAGITGKGIKVAVIGYGGVLEKEKPYLLNVNKPAGGKGSYHDGDELIHAVAPGAGMAALLKEALKITPEGFREFIKKYSLIMAAAGGRPRLAPGAAIFCMHLPNL